MSAPLVVNTRDGACWTRRTVTSGGIALYALADVCKCPEFVMATLDELAERGIVGSADALPVPAGPEAKPSDGFRVVVNVWNADDRANAEWAAELAQNALEGQGFKVFATVDEGEQDVAALEGRLRVAEDLRVRALGENDALRKQLGDAGRERETLRERVAELEAAARQIVHLHKDSPMGPCPVCVDADAMARGDDPTLPYPCPTARLAGAKDFDPPSYIAEAGEPS